MPYLLCRFRRSSLWLGLAFAATACYQEQHYTLATPQGTVPVTETTLTLPRRVRTRRQAVLPEPIRQQLAAYRQRHGFFPLTLAGLAADADSARTAVEGLSTAGFVQAELLDGGGPDSVTLAFCFATTARWITTTHAHSPDYVAYNRAAQTTGPAVEQGSYPGRFRLRRQPDGVLLVVKEPLGGR